MIDETHSNEGDFERLMKMDEEWPDHFEERSHGSRGEIEEAGERKLDAMANMAARPQSLQDYLHDQLGWFDLEPALRAMADRIIYNLDTNGYLQGRLEDLLGPDAGEEELALARRALALVQKLDPPGVGARDLRECLLLQLVPGVPHYEELRTLIANHLEDLEHNRLPAISRRTGYSIELIQEVLGELRKLNPKPGADFNNVVVTPVTPDVFVELDEDGKYRVRLEDADTPSLFISPYYRKLFQDPATSQETREYIKRKINSAQWLIDSIQQRRSTLLKVARAIVDYQKEFLDKGPEAIEPLKMQQIADQVGVHVTTVSRAVDEKWIQTPRGIFPLKRFFCGGTTSAAGEEVAWDTRPPEAARDRRRRRQAASAFRRSTRPAACRRRHHGRPPHGDEVSQGDGHSQFPPAARLGRAKKRKRIGEHGTVWQELRVCRSVLLGKNSFPPAYAPIVTITQAGKDALKHRLARCERWGIC